MKLISTCPSTAIQCSTRDSSYWKCCSENEIAFPSVESCTNGTLIQSECFPSTAVVFGGPGRHLDPRNSLLLFNLTKLTHIHAVKLTFSHNGGNVVYEQCESVKLKLIFSRSPIRRSRTGQVTATVEPHHVHRLHVCWRFK